MNRCHTMSDRMPEVAGSGSRWTRDEAGHLLTCPDCAAEWRLVEAAARLGQDAVSNLHPGQIAEGVVARLRAAPAGAVISPPSRARRFLLPLAVAAALVAAVWFGGPSAIRPEAPQSLVAVLPELDDLDETELESLVEAFTGPDEDPLRPLDAAESLEDLSDSELESLLRLMEG